MCCVLVCVDFLLGINCRLNPSAWLRMLGAGGSQHYVDFSALFYTGFSELCLQMKMKTQSLIACGPVEWAAHAGRASTAHAATWFYYCICPASQTHIGGEYFQQLQFSILISEPSLLWSREESVMSKWTFPALAFPCPLHCVKCWTFLKWRMLYKDGGLLSAYHVYFLVILHTY